MANIKKIKKQLVTLSEEDLKDVLEFLTDEEDVEDEDTKEEVVETKEEDKEEVKEEPKFATLEEIEGLLEKFKEQFASKEEVSKATKKAFGLDTSKKPTKSTTENKKTSQDYLNNLRNQGY